MEQGDWSLGRKAGGLRARLQQQATEAPRSAGPAAADVPFAAEGRRCRGCGAISPPTALGCIVCGGSLSGPLTYQVVASVVPALEISLEPGQRVYAETGCLGWMTDTVDMQTVVAGSPWALVGRLAAGVTPLVAQFMARAPGGVVAFTPRVPGRILPVEISRTHEFVLQRGAFLAAQESVSVAPHFHQNLGAMFFGGEGFILQRAHGTGLVFVQIDGDVVQYELQPQQLLLADPGSLAFCDASVGFSVRRVEGIKNVLFNQGLFLAELRGPGNVWLQTLPFARVVANIAQRFSSANLKADAAGGVAAGVLGALDSSGAGNALLGGLGGIMGSLG